MIKEESTQEETPFNMAMLFYLRLNKIIEKKDLAYLDGDIIGWFKGLKTIFRTIPKKYLKDKTKEIEKKLNEAYDLLGSAKSRNAYVNEQIEAIIGEDVTILLDKVDIELTDVMDKNHMIFPKIEVKGGLESVRKKYGLMDKHG